MISQDRQIWNELQRTTLPTSTNSQINLNIYKVRLLEYRMRLSN
uniref:Uncharacterized protein n=1 Tax=Utricularia reniformis TaxID=192314 RepID=A0A1Y0B3A4_9LAMI|nr:hypothetical protein AEK19_MT1645 [Utricularia reniformis]ART31829.1 hypothetical protein AEK19_MT1645 [Utricularia reniformis]